MKTEIKTYHILTYFIKIDRITLNEIYKKYVDKRKNRYNMKKVMKDKKGGTKEDEK